MSGRLVPLQQIGPWQSVREVIEAGAEARHLIETALTDITEGLDPSTVVWAAPIPNPSKILGMALNNSAIDKFLFYRPDFPVYFPKLPSALSGHNATLKLEVHYGLVHPEPELGVIIGKTAKNVSLADAMDYVFGYAVINDVTSAGMRMEDSYFGRYPMPKDDGTYEAVDEHLLYVGRYKNADGFMPMGPFIVTADEIPDPHKLAIKGTIDGEIIAEDNTRNLHYSVQEVIYWVSAHSTLFPGDILSMGTAVHPDGQSKPLAHGNVNRAGKVMQIDIEKIGSVSTFLQRNHAEDPRSYFRANKRFVKTLSE
jgi:2-keto-4-pentenoate hydratase/2-oxohepta-3-ene-1,7-dioic acid hydratase in catechol pathway